MIFAQSYKNLSYLQKKKENFSSFIKEKQYLCTLIIKKYDMPQTRHIAIIGGGAAGFFAAKCSTSMPSPAASICRQPGPRGMWWDNISENKLFSLRNKVSYDAGIFLVMVAICHGMNGTFGDKDGFSALRLCLIKRTKHGVGHEGILIAMDKEHRFGALANLLYLLRLGKRPAVAILAKS